MSELAEIGIALSLNGMDLITGLVGALRKKDLKSYKLRDGMFKKVGFIFCYLVGWGVDTYGYLMGLHLSVNVLPVIILYACTTELVSILENIHQINPDLLPEKLMELFHLEKEDNRNAKN